MLYHVSKQMENKCISISQVISCIYCKKTSQQFDVFRTSFQLFLTNDIYDCLSVSSETFFDLTN